MSNVTELATGQLTATETITVELVEADETPAVVIVRRPRNPPFSIPNASAPLPILLARIFAAAAVRLAAIKRERGGLR